jgi:hypothetical protein
MTTTLLVDILGWIGAALLLYAFLQVSAGRWHGQSRPYQVLNLAGSILFIINTGFHGAYPSVFVNIIWSAIAIRTLIRLSRSTMAPPGSTA